MDLKPKLLDPRQTVLLYGTTPPRLGTPATDIAAAADKLAARIAPLPLDALVVYDIQDETGRTDVARPFPFTATVDPRDYARLFKLPTIVYKALGTLDEASWRAWLADSQGKVDFLSIVGRPGPGKYALSLSRAIRIASAHEAAFTVGGVVITERHTAERSEAARLL